MAAIPSWVYFLLQIAIKIGSPYILSWAKNVLKNYPAVVKIIEDLINGIKSPDVDTKEARRNAADKLKNHCNGVACESETKHDA